MGAKLAIQQSSLLRTAMRVAFRRAFHQVQINPSKYLAHLRRVHALPIQTYEDLFLLRPEVLAPHANRIIQASAGAAALEGIGFGLGGLLTVIPDLGVLAAITIRLLQKLSLLYGFKYATEDEVTELWLAAASAAGLDLGREFLEKRAAQQVVPRIVDRVAVKVGAEIAEDWAGRFVPLVSAGIGGLLNYYFVRSWGRRAQRHFEDRHASERARHLVITAAGSREYLLGM